MPRLLSLDLARGFTVAFIPTIHCVMLYSRPEVQQSFFGNALAFIAEWPGAQLLLFVMGMSFCFSRKGTGAQLGRALILVLTGYALNAFKFLVPLCMGILPADFLAELNFEHNWRLEFHLLMIGDILQCAGISLMVLTILKRLPYAQVYALFLAYIVILCAPLFWDMHHETFISDHLLHLIGGKPNAVFFPLFPWLTYPLVGMAVGQYLQSQWTSVMALTVTGAFLLASGWVMGMADVHFPEMSFWRTYPDKTIMHLGFVLLWVSLWMHLDEPVEIMMKHLLMNKYNRKFEWLKVQIARLAKFLCYCSKHITLIYLLQWIVIFLMLGVVGYHDLNMCGTVVMIVMVNIAVFGAMKIWGN
jgi:hypothetical protein